ncbi:MULTISPECIES: amidohydrolase [unclassified Streptomyces]|uniref:amidohydrolase n=1 Tax=unclassified Streptomyces TaxID=2593676 RepID=UPI002E1770E5|nr:MULTISPECIES: amidohydrolase [unclassified Streptomyces]
MPRRELTVYPARRVRTMDPARPTAEAVAVQGDRVRAVGSLDELARYGPARIDDRYRDAVLFPGFVEAHTHLTAGAMWQFTYLGQFARMSPDGRTWPSCATLDAVLARLQDAEAVQRHPAVPLIAWGFDPLHLAGERLDRHHLDRVSTRRPVLVTHQSGHLMTVNSAALRQCGITRDTQVTGVVKEPDGEPTGELRETEAIGLVVPILPETWPLRPRFDPGAAWNFGADGRNHGVTTLTDLASPILMDQEATEQLRAVVDHTDFPARLSVFHMATTLVGNAAADPVAGAERVLRLRDTNSAKLRFGYVKLVLDGSIQGFTARLQPPGYLPDDREGIWVTEPKEFAEMFHVFHRAGLTVHVHCNGDEATQVFLDTVEQTLAEHPRWDHRHTVTHSQLTTPAQYRRMAALGMCANVFSNHIHYWGDQHRDVILGPDRAERMNAAASALRAGVPLSLHCDTPVTPLDPLATASYAVTRRTAGGPVLGTDERISVHQALHAVTLGAAFQLKMDHEVGSLEAGKYADFAVLGSDPWDTAPEHLADVEVFGSVVGGRHFPRGNGA